MDLLTLPSPYSAYASPPITEAVIEFKFAAPEDKDWVEKATKRFLRDYARTEIVQGVTVNLRGLDAQVASEYDGIRMHSADGLNILWIRTQGVTVSRLSPYVGWSQFRELAEPIWSKCRKGLRGKKLSRLGLRFVNRIDIPSSSDPIRIEDYLALSPSFPDPNQIFITYATQTHIPVGERFKALINTGSAPAAMIDHLSMLLDIDVYCDTDVPDDDSKIWATFDEMRAHKNALFESFVTDKTRRLFG